MQFCINLDRANAPYALTGGLPAVATIERLPFPVVKGGPKCGFLKSTALYSPCLDRPGRHWWDRLAQQSADSIINALKPTGTRNGIDLRDQTGRQCGSTGRPIIARSSRIDASAAPRPRAPVGLAAGRRPIGEFDEELPVRRSDAGRPGFPRALAKRAVFERSGHLPLPDRRSYRQCRLAENQALSQRRAEAVVSI